MQITVRQRTIRQGRRRYPGDFRSLVNDFATFVFPQEEAVRRKKRGHVQAGQAVERFSCVFRSFVVRLSFGGAPISLGKRLQFREHSKLPRAGGLPVVAEYQIAFFCDNISLAGCHQ